MVTKGYKTFLVMFFIFILLGNPFALQAQGQEPSDMLQKLDQLSQDVYTLTEQEKFAEAKRALDQLAIVYTQLGPQKNISIEAMNLSTSTLVQGKQLFAAIKVNKEELLWHAFQIRLMIDAITHPNQPIWKSYHQAYLEQVNKLIYLAGKQQAKDLEKALQVNMKLFAVLKPAFAIHQPPQVIEMMDSIYSFLVKQTHLPKQDWQAEKDSLIQLREASNRVFLGNEQSTFSWYFNNNSPYTMIAIMSSILLSVLTYAAWRMYQGTRYNNM